MTEQDKKELIDKLTELGIRVPSYKELHPLAVIEFSNLKQQIQKIQITGDLTKDQDDMLEKVSALVMLFMTLKGIELTAKEYTEQGVYVGVDEKELSAMKQYIPEYKHIFSEIPVIDYEEMSRKLDSVMKNFENNRGRNN